MMALQRNPSISYVEQTDSNAATGLSNNPLVENGADAIDNAREEHPSIIIMDIRMPATNGYEVIRRAEHADSNVATGLIENLFKNVQSVSPYQLRDINAHTVKNYEESVESSTSVLINSDWLDKQANSIFIGAKEEIFEDGMESDFSRNLSEFIASFGHFAMETIIPVILSERTNTEVASEAFRVLGRLNHKTTYRDRLWLLERGLYSDSARIRDGAVLGLAFLNDPLAIAPLKFAIERERIPELRQDMEQVLDQLEGNENGILAKKDTQK